MLEGSLGVQSCDPGFNAVALLAALFRLMLTRGRELERETCLTNKASPHVKHAYCWAASTGYTIRQSPWLDTTPWVPT